MCQKPLLVMTFGLIVLLAAPAIAAPDAPIWEGDYPQVLVTKPASDATQQAQRRHQRRQESQLRRSTRRPECAVVVNIGEMPPGTPSASRRCQKNKRVVATTATKHRTCSLSSGHYLAIFYLILLAWYAVGALMMSAFWKDKKRRR